MSSIPKHVKQIEINIAKKLKQIKKSDNILLEAQQLYHDEVLEVRKKCSLSLYADP